MASSSSPNETLKITEHLKGAEQLNSNLANLQITQLLIQSPSVHAEAIKAFLNSQNSLHHHFKAHTYSPTGMFKLKYYHGQWSHMHGITKVAMRGKLDQEENLLPIVQAIDPSIQSHLRFERFTLNDATVSAIMQQLKNAPIQHLSFKNCHMDGKSLLKAIEDKTLAVKILDLRHVQFNDQTTLKKVVSALEESSSIQEVKLDDNCLSKTQQARLNITMQRNRWLEQIQEQHPHETLRLNSEAMSAWKLHAITSLIRDERYQKIEIPRASPSQAIVKDWLEASRKNINIVRLVYNQNGLDPKLTHKLDRQININRSIKKIFGRGNPLFARSAMMYTFMAFNFFQSFIAAIAPSSAFMGGAFGGGIVGWLRVASNAWFHRGLKQTKELNYWDDASHQEAYTSGRESAKAWAPWFTYKAWTTPGYLGYTQEKNHMESALYQRPAPKR